MNVKGLLIGSLALAAVMVALAFYAAGHVPPGTRLPVPSTSRRSFWFTVIGALAPGGVNVMLPLT